MIEARLGPFLGISERLEEFCPGLCQLLINSSEMPRGKVAVAHKLYLFGYLTNQKKHVVI